MPHTIRAATLADRSAIRAIAIDTGLFGPDDWVEVESILSSSVRNERSDHLWIVGEDDGDLVIGAAYYAPEPFSSHLWNLYFLGVSPAHQGSGIGAALVAHAEDSVRTRGGRVLIIETSSNDSFARTRHFYLAQGYDEEARIRQFYGADEDKVVFRKALASAAT